MDAIHAAILCDVKGSRRQSDFRRVRDTTLEELSARHLGEGWIRFPYAVTAWDEFQGLTREISAAPRVIWSLITEFYPLRLQIGVGIGNVEVDLDNDAPLNEAATGEAFYRARNALNTSKKGRDNKHKASSQADSGNRSVDIFLNTTLHLLDTLVSKATPSQWEVILEYENLGQQDRVAEKLGKADSTVSRSLRRSHYWQMIEAVEAMAEFLAMEFPAQGNAISGDCS
jgi:hypothetical protein